MTLNRDDDIRLAEADATQAELRVDSDQELDHRATEDADEEEVAEIRADIEATRDEMGGTLHELGDRLDPAHIVDRAKENVREATVGRVEETAKGVSDMVMETIKRNPVPAAMAGAGLAMLWAKRSHGNGHNGHGSQGYRAREYGYYGTQPTGPGIGDRARDAASTVGDNVSTAVGSVAEGAQQTTGQVIDRAGQTVEQVGWRLDRFMQSNPLAMGAIAAGIGAIVGSLVPETPPEREMLGDASRQVASTVRDGVDQAANKAEETLAQAEEKVGSPA